MKFKYMLRGFGVGVLFSALVLAFSFYNEGGKISDTEVIKRAEQLGMVKAEQDLEAKKTDNQELSEQLAKEAAEKNSESQEKAAGESQEEKEAGKNKEAGGEKTVSEENEQTKDKENGEVPSDTPDLQKPSLENTQESQKEEMEKPQNTSSARVLTDEEVAEKQEREKGEQTENKEMVSIHVSPGMYSSQVADELMKSGVVESGSDLDQYLCQTEYAPKIQAGDFEIPKNATYEEIARILTRQ